MLFRSTAIATPACVAGAAAGLVGGLLALIVVHAAVRGGLLSAVEARFFQPRFEFYALAALTGLGAGLGWWGGRLPAQRIQELASDR